MDKMNRHSLRLVEELSGATIREVCKCDAGETVVLALTREQADIVEARMDLAIRCASIHAHLHDPAKNILEQIAHERDELAGE